MDFSADDEQALKQYLPSEFVKKDGSVNVEAQIERARRPVVDESKQAKKEVPTTTTRIPTTMTVI